MKRIGIMGGTFNPIHKGHLALAKAAQKEFALDQVIFIPSGNPPHKVKGEVVAKKSRLAMVKLALHGHADYSASRIEIDRPGTSYAIDTFTALRKKFGAKARLYYIMGQDSLNEIMAWKRPLELFRLCEFIVATRPGTKPRLSPRLARFSPIIHLMELKEDISASGIRAKLKAGKSVSKLVPAIVAKYISAKGLYQ